MTSVQWVPKTQWVFLTKCWDDVTSLESVGVVDRPKPNQSSHHQKKTLLEKPAAMFVSQQHDNTSTWRSALWITENRWKVQRVLFSFLGGGRVCAFVRAYYPFLPFVPPTQQHPTHRSHHPRHNWHTNRHRVRQTHTERRHRQEKEERWRRANQQGCGQTICMAHCVNVKETSKWRETHAWMVWYLYIPRPKSATTSASIKEHKSLKKIERKLTVVPHLWITELRMRGFDALSQLRWADFRCSLIGSCRYLLSGKQELSRIADKTCYPDCASMTMGGGSEGRWVQNFALFPFSPKISLCLSLGVFSLNLGGVWSAATLQRTLLGYLAIVWSASGPALVMTASNAQQLQWALSECTKTDFTWRLGWNRVAHPRQWATWNWPVASLSRNSTDSAAQHHSMFSGSRRGTLALGYSAVSVRTQGRLQLCQNSRTLEPRSPWATERERKAKTVKPLYVLWLCRKPLSSQKPNMCKLVFQVGSRRCWNIRGYPWNITLLGFAGEVLPRICWWWREKVSRTHWF